MFITCSKSKHNNLNQTVLMSAKFLFNHNFFNRRLIILTATYFQILYYNEHVSLYNIYDLNCNLVYNRSYIRWQKKWLSLGVTKGLNELNVNKIGIHNKYIYNKKFSQEMNGKLWKSGSLYPNSWISVMCVIWD